MCCPRQVVGSFVPSDVTDLRGRHLSEANATAGLAICNTGEPTIVRRSTRRSSLDLALVSQCCSYSWTRARDTSGWDYNYPIVLSPYHPRRGATCVYGVVKGEVVFCELCTNREPASGWVWMPL